jgi:hypothetical protein
MCAASRPAAYGYPAARYQITDIPAHPVSPDFPRHVVFGAFLYEHVAAGWRHPG